MPNSSPILTGWQDVLDKLEKIFSNKVTSRLVLRYSCLLWGMGGIGKTQICLKFIEEMSHKQGFYLSIYNTEFIIVSFSHLFWVDASSEESMKMSLRGISAQYSGVDGSAESILQWISFLQEECLVVFDNADVPPLEVVEKFIPHGNRGIL